MPKIPADIKEKSPKKLHFLLESTDKSKKSAPLGFRLASFRYLCHATISKWCTNICQPDLETLIRISDLLKVDVNDLLNKECIKE